MPGYGKHIGPAIKTPEGTIAELRSELARHNKLYADHIAELVDCLFEKYIEHPDKASEKLLIMHMGGKFFSKRESRLTERPADVLPCGHPKTCSIRIKGGEPHCEICGEPANAANA